MASVSRHLHQEDSRPTHGGLLSSLSKQCLASSLVSGHLLHCTITAKSGPRKIKNTLQSRIFSYIRRYLHDPGLLDLSARTPTINSVHCDAVSGCISAELGTFVLRYFCAVTFCKSIGTLRYLKVSR